MVASIQTLNQFFNKYTLLLSKIYQHSEAESITMMVIEAVFGYNRTQFLLRKEELLPAALMHQTEFILSQLLAHKPVQYVLGKAHFYGLELMVNEAVLIPRPETEEVVHWILNDYVSQKTNNLNITDVCTGSGCIALALKHHFSNANVIGIDISKAALKLAVQNAKNLKLDVVFEEKDILYSNDIAAQSVDVMVSNPPYIMETEMAFMQANVLEYEPHIALFVPNDKALIFYERIADMAIIGLKSGCSLYFEINEAKGNDMVQMLENKGFTQVELRQDMNGKDRMLKAVLA